MEIKKLHCLIIAIVAIVIFSFVSCEKADYSDTQLMKASELEASTNGLNASHDNYDIHTISTRGATRSWTSYYSENDIPNLICERLEKDNSHKQHMNTGMYGVELRVKRSFDFTTSLRTYAPNASIFAYVSVVDKNYNEKFSEKCYMNKGLTSFNITGDDCPVVKGDRITILFKTSTAGNCWIRWYPY